EGGLVSVQLELKPLNSDIIVKSVEYGLKELVHYHKSGADDGVHDITATIKEDRFPLGKKSITLNNSTPQNNSDPIQIDLRLCPRVNCDIGSLLINVSHQLSFFIEIEISEHVSIEVNNNYIDQYINRFRLSTASCLSNVSSYTDSEIRNSYSLNGPRTQSLPAPSIQPLSRSAPSNHDF
ncbi:31752_t:CDS:2, partial [Racocetra persica]